VEHQQTFRAAVDLVVVDVVVLDRSGRPVPGLTAADFVLTAGGRRRKIVTADYIQSGGGSLAGAPAAPEGDGRGPTESRSIAALVDIGSIRSSEGHSTLAFIGEFLVALPSSDLIALAVLPPDGGRVETTTSREAIRASMARMAGFGSGGRSCEATTGEASAESAGDGRGFAAFLERARALNCPTPDRRQLQFAVTVHRRHSERVLGAIEVLAESLAPLTGRKIIVFIGEVLFGDRETQQSLGRFRIRLERAGVVLYALHLDFPLTEASSNGRAATRLLDDHYGLDAMANASTVTGGAAFRVISGPRASLNRLDAELSGRYMLAFEREATDRSGSRLGLRVEVPGRRLDVRARSEVVIRDR